MTRYYYDTEFIEVPTRWGNAYDLVSIGIVAEDGRELYLVNSDMDVPALLRNEWLRDNVWPHLPAYGHEPRLDTAHPAVAPRFVIARQVRDFLLAGATPPDLWAWYSAHDHIVLTGLWGGMQQLPDPRLMRTNDLEQDIVQALDPERALPPKQSDDALHNALADARHARELGRWLGHS